MQMRALIFTLFVTTFADVAVLVPYRAREAHLTQLLEHWKANPLDVYVHIFVAEQDDEAVFNRGLTRNIAFREATKSGLNLTHVVFEDVDTWPKDQAFDHILTPPEPHKIKHVYGYLVALGLIWSVHIQDFEASNGFPNDFMGWGAEDDVVQNRLQRIGVHKDLIWKCCDINPHIGQDHWHERDYSCENQNRGKLNQWQSNPTGLNTLSYSVTKRESQQLSSKLAYHHIWVNWQ